MKLKNKIILLLAIVVGLSGCYPMTTKASSDNTIQNAMSISENGTYSGAAPEGGSILSSGYTAGGSCYDDI